MYGKKYISRFRNHFQNDYYRIEIWEKDYVGDYSDLTSGESGVFNINWPNGDTNLLEPIKASEATFAILTDGSIGIEDFYSDDDERFRVDFYYEYSPEKLLWTGYLVQDGASEDLTDIKHYIVFKATDNLGLLKNRTWGDTSNSPENPIGITGYIVQSLGETGLYSGDTTIDMNLPLRVFSNLYENTTDDRSDSDTADPMSQVILYPNTFQNSSSEWEDLYTILNKVLGAFNADVMQAEGYWNVRRIFEYRIFTDGEIPGTQYHYNGSGTDITAVTLQPMCFIARNGVDVQPIAEDQQKSMQRSLKYVQSTFNYTQPAYIIQNDLSLPPGATPYDTDTVDGIRTDYYDLATYFPNWVSRNGDASHLRIVTDTNITPEQEIDRYIHKPADFDVKNGLQFNPIPVSANDTIDFSFQFRNQHSDGYFFVRYMLIGEDGNAYSLDQEIPSIGTDVAWDGPYTPTDWYSEPDGVRVEKTGEPGDWFTYQLSQWNDNKPYTIPVSGMLLIEMDGNSSTVDSGFGTYQTDWKDVTLDIKSFVNESTQITGHIHKDELANLSKLTQENDLYADDSPRNTIAGTLFTDALTVFEYTDTGTGEETDIGNVFFTRTHAWHRAEVAEALRLGNITTEERLIMQQTSRLIIEGTFKNVRYDTDKFISPLTYFSFDFIPFKTFIAASMEIDYMNCVFKARLIEVFSDLDAFSGTYTFNYIYETQQ